MKVSKGIESTTTNIGLVTTSTIQALDIPGINDTKNTGLYFISMLTSILDCKLDGIFIVKKASSYRITDEML